MAALPGVLRPPPWRTAVAGLLGAAHIATAAAIRARHVAPFAPSVETISIPCPVDAPHLNGLRIGFLTDTHLGPVFSHDDVSRAVDRLLSLHPHLILLGGDFLCESPRYIDAAAAALAPCARAPLGAVAVLGNHDWSNDGPRLACALEGREIKVLCNQALRLDVHGGDLWIAGVDDAMLGKPDLDLAFKDVPAGAAAIALWHEPDFAEETARRGAFLQLSGHSHGGQIRLPFAGALVAPPGGKEFVQGLNFAAGMPIYTSRGVGVYRPPLRFHCSPEVTLVELTRSCLDGEILKAGQR